MGLPLDTWAVASDVQLRALLKRSGLIAANALVVDEFSLSADTVRADMVAAGEELVAYEIKAGADRLKRLPRQIVGYGKVFARVNIVTVPAHLDAVLALVPSWWGVMLPTGRRMDLQLHQVRAAGLNPDRSAHALCSLLCRDELAAKLQERGPTRGLSGWSKEAMVNAVVKLLAVEDADAYLRVCLKARDRLFKRSEPRAHSIDWNRLRQNFGIAPRPSI
ncbi:sce7726 family protein [Variovorax sp. J22G73]|uniref:sce7726 family protein n=1 Tax=unclassified Variovorax TaxID=663243 RepID=UPI002576D091|nr:MULTISPECIES: sce7726 family protein [unclassified Variovorax]MDM0007484.1 sce7726 family protein [Variovorax sp. J22R203]MDM0100156.1 sce7726 family protein [Variovorax sp. J22G73]